MTENKSNLDIVDGIVPGLLGLFDATDLLPGEIED